MKDPGHIHHSGTNISIDSYAGFVHKIKEQIQIIGKINSKCS